MKCSARRRWRSKLSFAARRALEHARAAGERFNKAKFQLRQRVLDGYDDYALTAELIRLEEANAALLKITRDITESRNTSGAAAQQDVLKIRNELDLSLNDIANMKSQRDGQRAAINALLSRPITAPLPVPAQLPKRSPMDLTDEQILTHAADHNSELRALAAEIRANRNGVKLAALQYIPDFSLGLSTDLGGIAQSLSGMVTLPLLRHEAIRAGIAEAEARLRSNDAMSRQAKNDLGARLLIDILTTQDADRQLILFDRMILPRAKQAVALSRSGYESGQTSLLILLEAQRSVLALNRLTATPRITREKHVVDIETATEIALNP